MQDGAIVLSFANVDALRLGVYAMDLELLFSTNPFFTSAAGGACQPSCTTGAVLFCDAPPAQQSRQLLVIQPNETIVVPKAELQGAPFHVRFDSFIAAAAQDLTLRLAQGPDQRLTVPLPPSFRNGNLYIEGSTGGGLSRSAPVFNNTLSVLVMEKFGQIKVRPRH